MLDQVCPPEFEVLGAPYSVRPSGTTGSPPDILVGRAEDFTDRLLPVAPVLAVEVLSPSTMLYDLDTKKAAHHQLGVRSYWVIDPEEPTLTVFELDNVGSCQQVAEVKGADAFDARRPFPVRVVPVELPGRLADRG